MGPWKDVLDREKQSLEDFKKRCIPYIKYQPKSDIEWLCLMQHHGLSTRLLDFTTNPLIALFFASDPTSNSDGELIVAKYGRSYENVSDDNLFDRQHNFAYHPPHITERIIGQQGCFVYSRVPNRNLSDKQIDKIKIPERNKFIIRNELSKLGISYALLFPSIDGICRDLNEALEWDLFTANSPF
jgi:hypothetical protein